MRAYLIDPENQVITEVDHDDSGNDIRELIQAPLFDVVRLDEAGTVIYIDDEGLFRTPQFFFAIRNYPHPIAGKGLVLGTGNQGRSAPPLISLEVLQQIVMWVTPAEALIMAQSADRIMKDHATKNPVPGFTDIFVSTTDIMEGMDYTVEPDGDPNNEAELPER